MEANYREVSEDESCTSVGARITRAGPEDSCVKQRCASSAAFPYSCSAPWVASALEVRPTASLLPQRMPPTTQAPINIATADGGYQSRDLEDSFREVVSFIWQKGNRMSTEGLYLSICPVYTKSLRL